MTPEEIDKYQRELDDYNIKVNTNCGDQANPVYQSSSTGGPSLGNECKSQKASPMRQWGATQRQASRAMKQYYKQDIRTLKRHRKGNIDYRFNSEFASRIEAALDYMQKNEPIYIKNFNLPTDLEVETGMVHLIQCINMERHLILTIVLMIVMKGRKFTIYLQNMV